MTKEQIKRVEELRGTLTHQAAHELGLISKQQGGPNVSNAGCFCKQHNIVTYINAFYHWYDGLQKVAGSDDE